MGAAGLPFVAVRAGKFRRMHGASALAKLTDLSTLGPNARDAVRVVHGLATSLKILRRFRPDVVFLKGGYVCLPVGLAARLLKIPYVIHESDMAPGLTNRVLARWAERIAVGFPVKGYRDWPLSKLVFTGNPVRPEILRAHRLEGLAAFKLTPELPVVLVTGGSQGAREINELVLDALPDLLNKYQVVHQTGEGEYDRLLFELGRRQALAHPERYHPQPFIMKEMPAALAAADVVVGRAGAQTIAELAVLSKPTILIPNTGMAGHQQENAKVLARAGAVRVLDGQRARPAQLVGEIKRILDDPAEQGRLGKALAGFGRPAAAQELAEVILEVGRMHQPAGGDGHDDSDEVAA